MSSAVQDTLRAAYPQALATLTRVAGDLDLAHDGLHIAVERALMRWADDVPAHPVAWLVRTGRNAIIDHVRHNAMKGRHSDSLRRELLDEDPLTEDSLRSAYRDDMARLVLTCCHPDLKADTAVMLTLHTVVGLSTDEIARAYHMKNRTVEQRVTRARRALRNLEGGYQPPTEAELPSRLNAALAVFSVLFNEGYAARDDPPYLRPQLCEVAIRSTRLLARLFRDQAEVQGLLALMLLQHGRAAARLRGEDELVSLKDQDRGLWNRPMLAEGLALVEKALRRAQLGPHQIQAAIAAVHASADDYESTRWQELVLLYDVLLRHRPNPVVRLNRAVAVSRARGAKVGLALLRELQNEPSMANYAQFFVVRGHLCSEAGDATGSAAAFERALELTTSPPLRKAINDLLTRQQLN